MLLFCFIFSLGFITINAQKKSKERITISQALLHPWFKEKSIS